MVTDLVDRVVLFTQADNEVAGGGLLGLGLGAAAWGEEEGWGRIAAEVVGQDTESADGVAEGGGDLRGRAAFEELGAEGLVLALARGGRLQEETAQFT